MSDIQFQPETGTKKGIEFSSIGGERKFTVEVKKSDEIREAGNGVTRRHNGDDEVGPRKKKTEEGYAVDGGLEENRRENINAYEDCTYKKSKISKVRDIKRTNMTKERKIKTDRIMKNKGDVVRQSGKL